MTCIELRNLRIELEGTEHDIVDDVSFSIGHGEIVGLVGESGSGKTTIGNAIMGFARRGARIAGGEIVIDGVDILSLDPRALSRARGTRMAYIPQDPTAALNPALRIRRQLAEALDEHAPELSKAERLRRLRAGLEEVGLPSDDTFLRRYPHQLSGGQQQRVVIAAAFLLRPKVIVLDEPTTGLDVSTQHLVITTVRRLCAQYGVAALYVTHDLSVIANLGHRVLVAYAGRIVESGTRDDVFQRPAHPYTRRLLNSIPDIAERRQLDPIPGHAPGPGSRPEGCTFAPRCAHAVDACRDAFPAPVVVAPGHTARCIRTLALPAPAPPAPSSPRDTVPAETILSVQGLSASYGSRPVLHDVGFEIGPRECLALVGESGSGKTTLSRALVGLMSSWEGDVIYAGRQLSPRVRARPTDVRREVQYIFQSPYNALNPRRTIGESISLPIEHFFKERRKRARSSVEAALERVSLPLAYADRFPDQLSGGERQRAAIARALVCRPTVLICDEVTSALDVSVQASIVKLLLSLQREEGLALLFVTHDLALVRNLADRVIVLCEGRVVEAGFTDTVLDTPAEAYTRSLLADTPRLRRLEAPLPSAVTEPG